MEDHGTWKWWFPIGISFSKGPFSGSMFVLGGVTLESLDIQANTEPSGSVFEGVHSHTFASAGAVKSSIYIQYHPWTSPT